MEKLYGYMRKKLEETTSQFFRYKYADIHWNNQMLALVGPRGVGKTTLFLQHIKRHHSLDNTLYVVADQHFFSEHSLLELAERFSQNGGQYLFIDEIHKYDGWSRELKEIYDSYSDLHVYFTGSSILEIEKGDADLSRRVPKYEMQGLSFREFLRIRHHIKTPVFSLEQIVNHKVETPNIKHPLPLFREYLRNGYYPFGNDIDFDIELEQVINRTMEVDIPQYANMNVSTGRKLKKLLIEISKNSPFKPNMTTLGQVIGASRNNIEDYLCYLEKAGMIGQLRDDTGGIRGVGKVEKVYVDNTNLMFNLGHGFENIGNIRETVFYNQMRVNHDVITSKTADFSIGKRTFEVGGKSKGQRQIADAEEGYIVKDDIEYGYGNVIPLWHFGLNY